jgi:hypothetical protein
MEGSVEQELMLFCESRNPGPVFSQPDSVRPASESLGCYDVLLDR